MNGFGSTPPVRENLAADTISDRRFQKVKLVYGEDGTAEDITRLNGLNVTDFTNHEILERLLIEQRLTNMLLNRLTSGDLSIDDLEDL